MKVIQFEQHGEPEVLQLVERPQPVPGADEVLIKVRSVSTMPKQCTDEGCILNLCPCR
jgi:NADPH:quinone reductase-like Zn-dependent oxidoreductase